MSRRKAPTLKQKLASALLTIVRPNEHGIMVPVIPYERAKNMTEDEIIACFHFDHGVFATWGGPNAAWNLTPRPVAEHIAKTKRDVGEIAKVRRGLKRRSGQAKPKKKIPSRPFPTKAERRAWKEQRGLA